MEIGFPTDVKHVAHIGWDGQSGSSAPSWVSMFRFLYLIYIFAKLWYAIAFLIQSCYRRV